MKKLILITVCTVYCFFALAQNEQNIASSLLQKMGAQPDSPLEIMIMLQEQVDLNPILTEINKTRDKRNDLRKAAIRQMQETARLTQPTMIGWMQSQLNIQEERLTKFWIINALGLKATIEEIKQIALNPMVRYISEPPVFEEAAAEKAPGSTLSLDPGQHELGHDIINAPALWKMGYTGYGTKVYIYDTGIDIEHPALRSNFSYHNNPLEVSWKGTREEPFTCTNHGSHVAGTILGLDREMNDTIGVAFNAQYMMSPQFTSCGSSRLGNVEAWQWVLDPDGNPETIAELPHAANMSGGSNVTDTICGNELIGVLFQGLQIGNIGAIFSAGNEGPGDSTVRSPAVHNFDLVHAFSVGNLNAASLEINGSSSRGPSLCQSTQSSLEIKPEVSAPGTNVRSSIVGGGYDWFTGTSMSAPHTTGAFLLLKEAFPFLTEGDILLALYQSAVDYGDTGEDNVYGMGVIDALAAFNRLVDQGHQPVPPLSNNKDLLAIDMNFDQRTYCSEIPMMRVKFENAGLDTLYEVQLDFKETNDQLLPFSKQWTGKLPPDEIIEMEFELPIEAVSGKHEITMQLSIPDTDEEVRTLNNQFKKRLRIFDEPEFSTAFVNQEIQTVCTGARVLLRTNTIPSENQRINWFNGAVSNNPDGKGETYLTPQIEEYQFFTTELESRFLTGMSLVSTNLEYGEENLGGLIFDVERPLKIERVKVNSGPTGGGRMIQLFDQNGESVISKLAIVAAGEQTIELNWTINQPAKGYRLQITTGKPFAHATNQALFPMEVSDLISIQSGMYNGVAKDETYYYFFDWEVSAKHPCGPAFIEVLINPEDTVGSLEILSEMDTVFLSNGGTLELEALGEGFDTYEWDLGSGVFETGQTVIASFLEAGIYTVSLNALSANGCINTAIKDIIVVNDLQTGIEDIVENELKIKVFPNPASDKIYIKIVKNPGLIRPSLVRLTDILGRVNVVQKHDFSGGFVTIDVQDIPPGQYILEIGGIYSMVVIQ